jgi:hypothetical protein
MGASSVSEWISAKLAGDPRWAAVEKIAGSRPFARATLLREFLLYISEHALSGRVEEISEQKIGHRVYKRSELYSPAEDNIVRVSAQQLRVKLREYYESEGQNELWTIEIPKGNYIPLFRKRDEVRSVALPPTKISPRVWLFTGAVAVAILLAGLILPRFRNHPSGTTTETRNLITSIFRGSHSPVVVVTSDEALVLMQAMLGHRFTLDEYTNQSYKEVPSALKNDPKAVHIWQILASRQIINLGDAGVASRIRDSLLQLGPDISVQVQSAQNMRPRDFLSGNFILLGESSSDPWVEMFGENRFNFQFSPDISHWPRPIFNTRPKPGEQKVYAADVVHHRSYARIVSLPNVTSTGKALLIAGTSMEGTEAAAEFCLRHDSVSVLHRELGIENGKPLPPFEILLSTASEGGAGVAAHVVSARRFGEAQ